MKREIKFKLWNSCGDKSKMFYDTESVMECLKQQIKYGTHPQRGYDHIGEGSAFMQYTGLHDKNGKEIYEGDILLSRNGHEYKVEFMDDGWKYKTEDEAIGAPLYGGSAKGLTVTGNIYEK